jgi:hypothetical protein
MLDLAFSIYTSCDSLDLIRILPYPLRRSIDQRYLIASSAGDGNSQQERDQQRTKRRFARDIGR